MVESHNYLNTYYPELKTFITSYPDYYITYAQYWDSNSEAGWNLHFGHKNLQKDYVLNVSNSGTNPIPSRVLNQKYLPYREIPKDIDDISDQLLSIADAETICQDLVAYSQVNHTFEISFIEDYYPDTLFDIWEGNSKEKEISDRSESRGAALINGYHGIVKDYEFGYWLTIPAPPLEEFHKLDIYTTAPAGQKFSYSNIGFSLLGYMVTVFSGKSFQDYLIEHIFNPLGMDHSDIYRTNRILDHEAIGYHSKKGKIIPMRRWNNIITPSGALVSSLKDMAPKWHHSMQSPQP